MNARQVVCIYPAEYQRWRDGFAEALDPRFYTIAYVDELIWTGAANFFSNEHAAAIAEIRIYPTKAMDVHGLVAAGDVNAIIELIAEIEAWGKSLGCIGGVIESRPAWARIMKSKGYEPHQIAVRKDL